MNANPMFKSRAEFVAATKEACDAGFLTCTSGEIGADDATYALGWLPLNHPETFSEEVRQRHDENLAKWATKN